MTERPLNRKEINTYLNSLYAQMYREKPVSVEQFIRDEAYLGKVTSKGNAIYPIWIDALNTIFTDDSKIQVVLTGAIGTGKTTASIIGLLYVMYRILLLKNPWDYFQKVTAGKMSISFFNLTKSLSDSRGFYKMQSYMLSSPWFRENAIGDPRIRNRVEYLEFSLFNYILASPYAKGFGTIGEDVISGLMDEVDSPTESIKQKERVLKAYEATVRRFESRFVRDGRCIGRLFLVASKQEETSFINTFITKMQDSEKVLIFDIPLWRAKPAEYFSGINFKVGVGDAFHTPTIIDDSEELTPYLEEGYQIVEVPVEYRDEFERDLVGALRDLAGISVAGMRRRKLFASERFIRDCFDMQKPNPVEIPTITIGLEDDVELAWYLDVSKFRMPKEVIRYIHLDISFSGDALGLAMSGIREYTEIDVEKEDGSFVPQRMPIIETDFVMRIKAREGNRIPLFKVRKLVLDLKRMGFRIKFSADLKLASEDTTQILSRAGVEVKYLSVDKTDKAYLIWRNLVYEKRWSMHYHAMTLFEAKHLEHDAERRKVDHPNEVKDIEILESGDIRDVVMIGSKDCTDAIVGSIDNCLSDSEVPIDYSGMNRVMTGLVSEVTTEDKTIVMRDSSGKEIVGIKDGDKMKKLSDIFKKLNQ